MVINQGSIWQTLQSKFGHGKWYGPKYG